MLQGKAFDDAAERAQQQMRAGLGLEPLLIELRGKGADKIDSIKIVRSTMHVTTAQAKSLVDRSEAWSDRYADDRALHEAVREAAEESKSEGAGIDVVIEDRSVDPD
jgi:ribosomal protein L7/L12